MLQQLVITYTLANVFPYVGFMAAGFEGYSIDNAGKYEILHMLIVSKGKCITCRKRTFLDK